MPVLAMLFLSGALLQNAEPAPDVSLTLACGDQPSNLLVTIQNAGASDTAVLAGLTFANGAWYEPRELVVELTRSGRAESEDLVYGGTRGVAGRIDPWIVTLPSRAAFTMTLRSSDFISTTQPTPAGAPEALRVRLTGRAVPADLNMDMGGVKGWRVWTGTARSNVLPLSQCAARP